MDILRINAGRIRNLPDYLWSTDDPPSANTIFDWIAVQPAMLFSQRQIPTAPGQNYSISWLRRAGDRDYRGHGMTSAHGLVRPYGCGIRCNCNRAQAKPFGEYVTERLVRFTSISAVRRASARTSHRRSEPARTLIPHYKAGKRCGDAGWRLDQSERALHLLQSNLARMRRRRLTAVRSRTSTGRNHTGELETRIWLYQRNMGLYFS